MYQHRHDDVFLKNTRVITTKQNHGTNVKNIYGWWKCEIGPTVWEKPQPDNTGPTKILNI